MDCHTLLMLACTVTAAYGLSAPFYPVHRAPGAHRPLRVTRYPAHPHRIPVPVSQEESQWQRPKRDHDDYDDHREKDSSGVTGPVHTFVKTDKNANYKWGVRHHVGNKYAA